MGKNCARELLRFLSLSLSLYLSILQLELSFSRYKKKLNFEVTSFLYTIPDAC